MENVIKVLNYFKNGLEDIEQGSRERQPMQYEIELALLEVKNSVVLADVSNQRELLIAFSEWEDDNVIVLVEKPEIRADRFIRSNL